MTDNEKATKSIKEAVNALVDLLFNKPVKTEEVVSGPEAMERIRKARADVLNRSYAVGEVGPAIIKKLSIKTAHVEGLEGYSAQLAAHEERLGNLSARVLELEAALKDIGVKYDAAAGNGAGGYALDHLKAQLAAHERTICTMLLDEMKNR